MKLQPKARGLHLIGLRPTGDLGPLTGYTTRHGRGVWFMKAPPKTPPTCWQTHQRNAFRALGAAWSALSQDVRDDWQRAAKLARLTITGYNLWTWYGFTNDSATILTIEHQTGVKLISLPPP